MKHHIDIFGNNPHPDYPADYRRDRDQNASLLNIVFAGGTFGNFLRYFLERFSTKTPDVSSNPFTNIGTSHLVSQDDFSGLIQRYHESFINDNEGNTDLPICLIIPSKKKHFLYLKKSQWFRAADQKISPDDLWKKSVDEMPNTIASHVKEIMKLYDIKETATKILIPKFIVRDWYKLEFLQSLEDTYNYQWFDTLKKHPFWQRQKMFYLDLETFFNWNTFIKNIKELNNVFDLSLDLTKQSEMKEIFNNGLTLDTIRQECNLAEEIIMNVNSGKSLDNLDVATEGFIYAELEKSNDFIQMPLTNRFFRDMEELSQFVEHYPNHYKAMNPNMPKFNGISNPYYLKKGE